MDDTTPARIGEAYIYLVFVPGQDAQVFIDTGDMADVLAKHDAHNYFRFSGVVNQAEREDGETVNVLQGSGAAPGMAHGTIVRYRDKCRLPGMGDELTDELGRIVEEDDEDEDEDDGEPVTPPRIVESSGLPRIGR